MILLAGSQKILSNVVVVLTVGQATNITPPKKLHLWGFRTYSDLVFALLLPLNLRFALPLSPQFNPYLKFESFILKSVVSNYTLQYIKPSYNQSRLHSKWKFYTCLKAFTLPVSHQRCPKLIKKDMSTPNSRCFKQFRWLRSQTIATKAVSSGRLLALICIWLHYLPTPTFHTRPPLHSGKLCVLKHAPKETPPKTKRNFQRSKRPLKCSIPQNVDSHPPSSLPLTPHPPPCSPPSPLKETLCP